MEQGDEFSVYIIDWLIPDMNGIEVVRQIRKVIGQSCPIIILTAYDLSLIHIYRRHDTAHCRPHGKYCSPCRLADVSGKVPQECRHGGGSGVQPGRTGDVYKRQRSQFSSLINQKLLL